MPTPAAWITSQSNSSPDCPGVPTRDQGEARTDLRWPRLGDLVMQAPFVTGRPGIATLLRGGGKVTPYFPHVLIRGYSEEHTSISSLLVSKGTALIG